jgi:hypothetical protein
LTHNNRMNFKNPLTITDRACRNKINEDSLDVFPKIFFSIY